MISIKDIMRPIQVVAFERPQFHLTDENLQQNLEVIQDEIESKGGYESLGRLTQEKYQIEIDYTLNEIKYRN